MSVEKLDALISPTLNRYGSVPLFTRQPKAPLYAAVAVRIAVEHALGLAHFAERLVRR